MDRMADLIARLRDLGMDAETIAAPDGCAEMKIVCVPSSLQESLQALAAEPRDQVVMVRVDGQTLTKLDAWVKTGAVGSRSEAAALFIREGLEVRAPELRELDEPLRDLDAARARLQARARRVLSPTDNAEGDREDA